MLLSSTKNGARRRNDRGFTLIEILVVVAIVGILAAIAMISLARARQSGNEASAIASIRAITSGQAAYASSCGSGGYAQSNADLAKGPAGGAPFISPDLAEANVPATAKSGYTIDVNDSDDPDNKDVRPAVETCNGSVGASRAMYHLAADPVSRGGTGTRSFGSDRRGTIYYSIAAPVANPIPDGLDFIQ